MRPRARTYGATTPIGRQQARDALSLAQLLPISIGRNNRFVNRFVGRSINVIDEAYSKARPMPRVTSSIGAYRTLSDIARSATHKIGLQRLHVQGVVEKS